MTEGARRCWLIKSVWARACTQGHQADRHKAPPAPLKQRRGPRRPRRDAALYLSHGRLNARDVFDLAKNVAKGKKKKGNLGKMSFACSPLPPQHLCLLLYLRNAEQQGATEDLQIGGGGGSPGHQ